MFPLKKTTRLNTSTLFPHSGNALRPPVVRVDPPRSVESNKSVVAVSSPSAVKLTRRQLKVKLICNWCTNEEAVQNQWARFTQDPSESPAHAENAQKLSPPRGESYQSLGVLGSGVFSDAHTELRLVTSELEKPDLYVIANRPCNLSDRTFVPEKTLVFCMEPDAALSVGLMGCYGNLREFLYLDPRDGRHLNFAEWMLAKSYSQLLREVPPSGEGLPPTTPRLDRLSAVLTGQYATLGHRERIDFLHYLGSKNLEFDLFGWSNPHNFPNYRGKLPDWNKQDGLCPYKYTFTGENCRQNGYVSEKLYDALFAECLCFYSGAPNVAEFIDPRAFIQLDLSNPEQAYQTVRRSIENHEWERRLPWIRREKRRLLTSLTFGPRVLGILALSELPIYLLEVNPQSPLTRLRFEQLGFQSREKIESKKTTSEGVVTSSGGVREVVAQVNIPRRVYHSKALDDFLKTGAEYALVVENTLDPIPGFFTHLALLYYRHVYDSKLDGLVYLTEPDAPARSLSGELSPHGIVALEDLSQTYQTPRAVAYLVSRSYLQRVGSDACFPSESPLEKNQWCSVRNFDRVPGSG